MDQTNVPMPNPQNSYAQYSPVQYSDQADSYPENGVAVYQQEASHTNSPIPSAWTAAWTAAGGEKPLTTDPHLRDYRTVTEELQKVLPLHPDEKILTRYFFERSTNATDLLVVTNFRVLGRTTYSKFYGVIKGSSYWSARLEQIGSIQEEALHWQLLLVYWLVYSSILFFLVGLMFIAAKASSGIGFFILAVVELCMAFVLTKVKAKALIISTSGDSYRHILEGAQCHAAMKSLTSLISTIAQTPESERVKAQTNFMPLHETEGIQSLSSRHLGPMVNFAFWLLG